MKRQLAWWLWGWLGWGHFVQANTAQIHAETIKRFKADEAADEAGFRAAEAGRTMLWQEIIDLKKAVASLEGQLEQMRSASVVTTKPKVAPVKARNWRDVQFHMAGEEEENVPAF